MEVHGHHDLGVQEIDQLGCLGWRDGATTSCWNEEDVNTPELFSHLLSKRLSKVSQVAEGESIYLDEVGCIVKGLICAWRRANALDVKPVDLVFTGACDYLRVTRHLLRAVVMRVTIADGHDMGGGLSQWKAQGIGIGVGY